MVAEPVVLWTAGQVECIVVHHPGACSYEIRILDHRRLLERRWFGRSEDALAFTMEQGARFGATDSSLPR